MALQNHMQCYNQIAFGFVMTQTETDLSKFSAGQFRNQKYNFEI